MVVRAVSAGKALTPLAVLVPVLAVPLGAAWIAPERKVSALILLLGGFAAIATLGRFTYGLLTSVVATLLTWGAMVVSFPIFFVISINTSICGKNIPAAWEWLPPTLGALAFLAVGSWGLHAHRWSWTVLLGYLVGFGLMVALFAAVPGTPGFCET
jgi:hypothetical protein